MRGFPIFGVLLLCTSAAPRILSLPDISVQETLQSSSTAFRDIRSGDIPALTTLLIAAFSPGPMYHYIAPDLSSHYEEFWSCMNKSLTHAWEQRNCSTTLGRVIAVDDKPVSAAVWNIRANYKQPARITGLEHLGKDCIPLPGTNDTRFQDFERQNSEIQQRHFTSAYPRQLYLNLLMTHPSWDGHEFAARHLEWGKELSLKLTGADWPITLLATPMGWPVYNNSGFQSVANVTIEMLDGLGDLWFEVMRWERK